MSEIDAIQLNLNTGGLMIMNASLFFIMFGVALELTIQDFKDLAKNPTSTLSGIFSQFVYLPLITFCFILIVKPQPSFALGMMMVAACPGGNISNFFSQLAGANIALSVTMSAIATVLAIIATPFNFMFWASIYPPTSALLQQISLDIVEVFNMVGIILGVPLFLGMTVRHLKPKFALTLTTWIKSFGIIFFAGFIVVAFSMNMDNFIQNVHHVLGYVFIHNALALIGGFSIASIFKLSFQDKKTIAIETGIQNSGLGLLLIFNFFDNLGGMALIAAWWGIWHIIMGFLISWYWFMGKNHLKKICSNV